jgi:site-specific recombinase XerD
MLKFLRGEIRQKFEVRIMTSVEIEKLAEQTLFSLKESGMTAGALQHYKVTGFRVIIERHAELGHNIFSFGVCDELIRELRVDCELGKITKSKWQNIRRCAELMRAYQNTGTAKLPSLGRWEPVNAPYRVKPSQEQLADSDNIFAIVWKVKRELVSMGMGLRTIHAYTYGGFDKILRHFIMLGLSVYDDEVLSNFVAESHEDNDRRRFQLIRKAAAYIQEYYQNECIEPKHLEIWGRQKLANYFSEAVEKYKDFNSRKNNWSLRTKTSVGDTIGRFLMVFEQMGYYDFHNITPKIASDCVSIAATCYKGGLKSALSQFRSFLCFVHEHKMSPANLSKAIPGRVSPKRAVYSGFSHEEIEKLLSMVDLNTPQGKRDYAILLIGLRTGMRAVDVAKLKYQDIDWRTHSINIVQSKTNRPLGLPLSTEVGNAIADYILNGRQPCGLTDIFIRSIHPRKPLTPGACGDIVRKYFRKAELQHITNRPIGFHTLRRTFGTHMLQSGVSVDMIQELLGQTDIDSVQPYLSANEKELKVCAIGLVSPQKAGGES